MKNVILGSTTIVPILSGTSTGILTVDWTGYFRIGFICTLTGNGLPTLSIIVSQLLSETTVLVLDSIQLNPIDASQYTLSLNASLSFSPQQFIASSDLKNFISGQLPTNLDSFGNLRATSSLVDGQKSTYSASGMSMTLPSPYYVSFFFIIKGSVTKTVRITNVSLSGTQTTGGQHNFALYKLLTVSGGTPTIITPIAHDSQSLPPTATVTAYTTGSTPTSLTVVGTMRSWSLYLPATTNTAQGTIINESFGNGPQQSLILRGINECLALTLIGAAPTGASMNANFSWTEE